MKDLILALARRGKTVILSSHLLADVEDVCDRVLILYGGRLQAVGPLKELLRKPDRLRITTPVLSRPTLERVLATIRLEVGDEAEVRVENPTQNLESFFLEVVERARRAAAETSGALSGARVAPYLRGETEAKPAGERLLEKLTLPSQAPERPAQLQVPAPAVDEQKLQALAAPGSTPPEAPPPPSPPPEEESLAKADEKLASLLSKPKG
jgi:ABC-2 type transport system ATP-binding protein